MGGVAQRLHVATTSSPSTSPCAPRRRCEAIDLLTDFVGRPQLDAEELDRERGVVIQEIQRYKDQPSAVAEELIDRAAFGDHPLGRTVLGPEEHLRTFTRDAIVAFRERRWAGARGGAFIVGNLDHVPDDGAVAELLRALPAIPAHGGLRAGAAVRAADARRGARHQPVAPADDLPPRRSTPRDPRERAALTIYSTLLGGSMGSRLFDEIREQRGLCYSVYGGRPRVRRRRRSCSSAPGLESGKCVEAYTRMREIVAELRDDGPDRGGGRARARLRRRPPRARLREHERGRALRGRARRSSSARTSTPTRRSRRSTRSPSTRSPRWRAGSRGARGRLRGPARADEFA